MSTQQFKQIDVVVEFAISIPSDKSTEHWGALINSAVTGAVARLASEKNAAATQPMTTCSESSQ